MPDWLFWPAMVPLSATVILAVVLIFRWIAGTPEEDRERLDGDW